MFKTTYYLKFKLSKKNHIFVNFIDNLNKINDKRVTQLFKNSKKAFS